MTNCLHGGISSPECPSLLARLLLRLECWAHPRLQPVSLSSRLFLSPGHSRGHTPQVPSGYLWPSEGTKKHH